MEPFLKMGTQNLPEDMNGRGKNILKSIYNKAKLCKRTSCKRKECSAMDVHFIRNESNVVSLKDNGKYSLRRNSFQETATQPPCHYENVTFKSLVSVSCDMNQNEDGTDLRSGRSQKTKKGELLDVSFVEDVPKFRRGRRNAIAEVTQKDRDVIVRELRKRALAKNLTHNGLLKL